MKRKGFSTPFSKTFQFSIVVKDARSRKCILVNRAFEAMIQMPQRNILGKTALDIFGPEDAEFIDRNDDESTQVGQDLK